MSGYSPFGPWTDGSPPGIQSTFLTALEAFLVSINSAATDGSISASSGLLTVLGLVNNVAAVSVAGTTSGNAYLYEFIQGSIKAFIVYQAAYRNSTATEQKLSLPSPITIRSNYLNGASVCNIYKSGSKVTNGVACVTTLATPTSGGNATIVTSTPAQSYGEISPSGGYDAIGLGTSMPSPITGLLFVVGI